ncbi:MAG: gliding motility-associated C-terminal domain-containing protein, partial [Flammeovirgaceae bacterium]
DRICGFATATITFKKLSYQLGFVPNVITPNGDGKNDFLEIDTIFKGLVSLRIFNRWGDEVYYSKKYENDWSGSDLTSGVYFVVLEGACIERFKSPVTVMR